MHGPSLLFAQRTMQTPEPTQSQDVGLVIEWDENWIWIRCPFCHDIHPVANTYLDASEVFLLKQCPEYKKSTSALYIKELVSAAPKWGVFYVQFPVDRLQDLAVYEIDKQERKFVSCLDVEDDEDDNDNKDGSREADTGNPNVTSLSDALAKIDIRSDKSSRTVDYRYEQLGNNFSSLFIELSSKEMPCQVEILISRASDYMQSLTNMKEKRELQRLNNKQYSKYLDTLRFVHDLIHNGETDISEEDHQSKLKPELLELLKDPELATIVIYTFIILDNDKALNLVIDVYFDISSIFVHDRSPVVVAAIWRRTDMVRTLLRHGATRNDKGKDALQAIDFLVPCQRSFSKNLDISSIAAEDMSAYIKEEISCRRIALMLQYYKVPSKIVSSSSYKISSEGTCSFTRSYDRSRSSILVTIHPLDITINTQSTGGKAVGVLRRGDPFIDITAISGWSTDEMSESSCISAREWTLRVLDLCQKIDYQLAPSQWDRGIPGQYNASHAEKQLLAYLFDKHVFLRFETEEGHPLMDLYDARPMFSLPKVLIHTSKVICEDCQDFLQYIAEYCGITIEVYGETIVIDLNAGQ